VSDTLKSLRTEIQLECRGDFSGSTDEDTIVNAAISDAVEKIWMAMMQVHLAKFFGVDSPVTFSLPANTERVRIVSIQDPTVAPVLATVAGGALVPRTYLVSYTYVTESGSETLPSPISTLLVGAGQLLQVAAPLNPPNNVFGWNLYVGVLNQALQNQQPLPFGVQINEPPSGFQDYPTNEQVPPITNTTADNLSYIQHLEIRNSDTLLRAWNQVEIDSQMMRRMAATLPSASEYQTYVWELTGNGVLEFRPMTGSAFSPRYWYIAKPRRLRYDQAEVPYVSIMGVHEYIKSRAKASLYLGVNEFLNAQGWKGEAGEQMLQVQMTLMQELWGKNCRIVPYMT
jgi:hypothetical protein